MEAKYFAEIKKQNLNSFYNTMGRFTAYTADTQWIAAVLTAPYYLLELTGDKVEGVIEVTESEMYIQSIHMPS